MTLKAIDWIILLVYFVFVLGIGFALKRYVKTSTDFFLSGRSIPAWITGLAFLSANLGAQEVIGMAASGAKYGIATSHFYWVGAIPAMVFVGVFMMPFITARERDRSPSININLFWGAVLLIFGVTMLLLGKRGTQR